MDNKKDLEECRLEINRIDEQIAGLFEQRMDVARDIAEYKKEYGLQIFDAAREQEVCYREVNFIHNPDYRPYYLEFLKAMMSTGKRFQSQVIKGSKIAYCGIEGAWANIAARRIFPDGNLVSFPSFDKAYESVVKGHCDFAVLPVENSYAGNVNQVFDLMHQGSLFINGMYNLKIAQALLGIKGAKISDVKKVISHQQALDQCMKYLQSNGFSIQAMSNTAVAAREVAALNDKSVAAIASEETAQLYGLEVLQKEINQSSMNTTRFAVFSRVKNEEVTSGARCLFQMMFTVKNYPGSLASAIKAFADAGINLRSLQSRPIKDVPWQYYFYVEGEGSLLGPEGQGLIDKLHGVCEEVKVLGHYQGDINI